MSDFRRVPHDRHRRPAMMQSGLSQESWISRIAYHAKFAQDAPRDTSSPPSSGMTLIELAASHVCEFIDPGRSRVNAWQALGPAGTQDARARESFNVKHIPRPPP